MNFPPFWQSCVSNLPDWSFAEREHWPQPCDQRNLSRTAIHHAFKYSILFRFNQSSKRGQHPKNYKWWFCQFPLISFHHPSGDLWPLIGRLKQFWATTTSHAYCLRQLDQCSTAAKEALRSLDWYLDRNCRKVRGLNCSMQQCWWISQSPARKPSAITDLTIFCQYTMQAHCCLWFGYKNLAQGLSSTEDF